MLAAKRTDHRFSCNCHRTPGSAVRDELARFIQETKTRFGAPQEDWRRTITWVEKTATLDSTLLGLEALTDVVRQLGSGAIDESHIPTQVLEAFHLQFPNTALTY
jgi:hypothetical protein